MRVNARFLHGIAPGIGSAEEAIELDDGALVSDLVAQIVDRVRADSVCDLIDPQTGEYDERGIKIALQREGLVGARILEHAEGMRTELQADDTIVFFQPIVGG